MGYRFCLGASGSGKSRMLHSMILERAEKAIRESTALQENNLLSLSYGNIKRKPIDSSGGLLPESFDGYNIIEENDIEFAQELCSSIQVHLK